ncbi:hypothetical protein AWB71_02365 [Caballeronia peredens]|nr:hypothetical protein AWB71_02365 [Caballeronia peredens]
MQQRISRLVRIISATATAGVALASLSVAQAQPPASPAQGASAIAGVGEALAVNVTAKVTNVFADTNSVEVKGPEGRTVVVAVDPAIADVKKLKVGDDVHMAYRSAVLISADKVDSKGLKSNLTAQETTPASGGVVVRKTGVQVVAVVEKIDAATREVTLSGPKHTVTLKVQDDIPLDKFKVGDSVMATYLAATAVDVTRNGQLVK